MDTAAAMCMAGERIVGTLGHVGVIVWMQKLFSCDFVAAVGNHFVDVHVGLGSTACLPHGQREMPVQLAGKYLVTAWEIRSKRFSSSLPRRFVGHSRRLF